MHPDALRWNARYRARGGAACFDAQAQLVTLADRLGAPGRALDLACGTGANALWLAARGWRALGLDVSVEGLRLAQAEARSRGLNVQWVVADAARAPLVAGCFQLVVVTRYLERDLFPSIQTWLAPGGLLYYSTFNVRHLARHPRFNPHFVLNPGELDAAFPKLVRVDGNDGVAPDTDITWMLARREV